MFCDEKVKISVIVPVYNGADFIPGLVSCMKNQREIPFEVVFVDDGSRDDSAAVLDDLAKQDLPFVCRVIHQPNGGVSAARNRGLEAARGEYISFVDVDDLIAPDYLRTLYRAIQDTGKSVAVAHITRNPDDLISGQQAEAKVLSSTEFLREFLYRGIRYHICACMFAKECFESRNVKFPEGYRYSEDVFVLWQIFAGVDAVAEVARQIYCYVDNPLSAMNAGIDIRRMDAIVLMKKLEGILAELNPEFSVEFNRYAVARHHWSILWQAAAKLNSYRKFREYSEHFEMRSELKKLVRYPEKRISLSSAVYVVSPAVYYYFLRVFFALKNKKGG